MESSYIIFLLQPYYENFNNRLIKSPELYFYDAGLLTHLLGIRTANELLENRWRGNIFENLILAEYQKKNHHLYMNQEYFFWRDSNVHEIDLLMKQVDAYSIYEIKATQTITNDLFKEMDRFEEISALPKVTKTLICSGAENEKRTKYTALAGKMFLIRELGSPLIFLTSTSIVLIQTILKSTL